MITPYNQLITLTKRDPEGVIIINHIIQDEIAAVNPEICKGASKWLFVKSVVLKGLPDKNKPLLQLLHKGC